MHILAALWVSIVSVGLSLTSLHSLGGFKCLQCYNSHAFDLTLYIPEHIGYYWAYTAAVFEHQIAPGWDRPIRELCKGMQDHGDMIMVSYGEDDYPIIHTGNWELVNQYGIFNVRRENNEMGYYVSGVEATDAEEIEVAVGIDLNIEVGTAVDETAGFAIAHQALDDTNNCTVHGENPDIGYYVHGVETTDIKMETEVAVEMDLNVEVSTAVDKTAGFAIAHQALNNTNDWHFPVFVLGGVAIILYALMRVSHLMLSFAAFYLLFNIRSCVATARSVSSLGSSTVALIFTSNTGTRCWKRLT